MHPDTVSVILRSASFIALFQAAGMVLFIAMFGRRLEASLPALRRITTLTAIAAAAFLIGQYALEAARMADDMAGIADPSLQMLAMHSASSAVLVLRLLGLSVIVGALGRGDLGMTVSVIGAAGVIASFLLIGHTAAHPFRWALASLLLLHLLIVAFWLGALPPLYLATRRESALIAAKVTDSFSRVAAWAVPGIFAVGLLMGLVLVRHLAEFRLAYGISLLSKAGGFALLMGLAALNKWRLGPAIASGNPESLRAFRSSLIVEYLLIGTVLSITAAMTTLFSPEP